jgi:hypothetical protein
LASKGLKEAFGAENLEPVKSAVIRLKLVGGNSDIQVNGLGTLPGISNYFIGNDSSKWITSVPQFSRAQFKQVFPGTNLDYYGKQGQLEYDFRVSPGTDAKEVHWEVDGANVLTVDANGNLVIGVQGRNVMFKVPMCYQEAAGKRNGVAGRYSVYGKDVRFEIGHYDKGKELVTWKHEQC